MVCSLKVYVKNSKGELVESNLYNSLLAYLPNRATANLYYDASTSEQFREDYGNLLDFDENDEPTFESFRKVVNLDLDRDKTIRSLNREIGSGTFDYSIAATKMQNFNSKHVLRNDFLATLERQENGQYKVSIVENTDANKQALRDTIETEQIIQRLDDLLRSYGVATTFANGNFFGRYSTKDVKKMANGLYSLIQLSNNNTNVADNYAEEAGHFAVGAMGDHILIKRLEALLKDKDLQKALFGDEFNSKDFGSTPIREMMGDLVGKALLAKVKNQTSDAPQVRGFKNLLQRFVQEIKNVFKQMSASAVERHMNKAHQLAEEIALGIVNHSYNANMENALNTEETLYSRRRELKKFDDEEYPQQKEVAKHLANFTSIVTEFEKLDKQLHSLNLGGTEKDTYFQKVLPQFVEHLGDVRMTSFEDMEEADQLALKQIAQASKLVYSLATDLDTFCKSSASYLNDNTVGDTVLTDQLEQTVFKNLRRVAVTMQALQNVYKTLYNYNNNKINPTITIMNERGEREVFDLGKQVRAIRNIMGEVKDSIDKSQQQWFLRFLTKTYGKQYITMASKTIFAHGHQASSLKEKEENIKRFNEIHGPFKSIERWSVLYRTEENQVSIEDLLTGEGSFNVEDISWYAKWLSSMQDCGDVIQGICKKAIDHANRRVLKETEKERYALNQWAETAKKRGIDVTKGLRFFKKRNGKITHYLLARFDYGRWEEGLEKLRMQLNDEFIQYLDHKMPQGAEKLYEEDKITFNNMRLKYSEKRIKEWHKANSHFNKKQNRWEPNVEDKEGKVNYSDPEYFALKPGERTTLEEYFEWKQNIENKVGTNSCVPWRAPQIKGSFGDRVQNRNGLLKRYCSAVGDALMDKFIYSTPEDRFSYGIDSDTNEFESLLYDQRANSLLDINRVMVLGMRKRPRPEDLSTNLLGSSYAYANMCHRKIALDGIVNALEIGKNVLKSRKIQGQRDSDPGVTLSNSYESYIRNVDRALYNKLPIRLTKVSAKANLTLFKLMGNIKGIGTLLCLGFNHNPAIVNAGTGFNEILKEAGAGEWMNYDDFLWAHKMYARSRFANLSAMSIGKYFDENASDAEIFDNKVGRFLMYLDAQNNYRERIDKSKNSWAENFFRDAPFFGYSFTDNYMQGVPFLAMAHNVTLFDTKTGKMVNLIDIYDVKYKRDEYRNIVRDSSGKPIIEDYGFEPYRYTLYENANNLQRRLNQMLITLHNDVITDKSEEAWNKLFDRNRDLIDTLFKKQGIPVVKDVLLVNQVLNDARDKLFWSDKTELEFILKAREVADRLHGIYSKIDSVNLQGTPYGASLLSMKGYALGMIERRFSSNYFNVTLNKNVEGNYTTFLRMWLDKDVGIFRKLLAPLVTPFSSNLFGIESHLKSKHYDDNQIANIKRTGMDIYVGTAMIGIMTFLGSLIQSQIAAAPDDDDDEPDEDDYSLFWKKLKYNRFIGALHYFSYKMMREQWNFTYIPYAIAEGRSLSDLVPVGASSGLQVLGDIWKAFGACIDCMQGMSDYDKPLPEDYLLGSDDPEYKEAIKEWKSRCNKMFGVQHNPIQQDNLDLGLLNLKPVQKLINDIPTPIRHITKSSDYEKNIESDKHFVQQKLKQ